MSSNREDIELARSVRPELYGLSGSDPSEVRAAALESLRQEGYSRAPVNPVADKSIDELLQGEEVEEFFDGYLRVQEPFLRRARRAAGEYLADFWQRFLRE